MALPTLDEIDGAFFDVELALTQLRARFEDPIDDPARPNRIKGARLVLMESVNALNQIAIRVGDGV